MAIKRRTLLALLGAGPLTATKLWSPAGASTTQASWLSAFRTATGHYGVGMLDDQGQLRKQARLPVRAHAVIATPDRHGFVVLERRPGTFAALIDTATGQIRTRLDTTPERHFYGHGVFSQDGELFFTTENDFDGEHGVIGIRSVSDDYRQMGEWSSYGIGPHELVLSADGHTLIIANGGILTHPDSGRAKLNLASMQSTLIKLDAQTGQLLDRLVLAPALRHLSIRHLAVAATGDIVFGMQNQGPTDPTLPLVGIWRANGELVLLHHSTPLNSGYIGSVALDSSGKIAATSAPRDDNVLFWRVGDGQMLASLALADGCGIAAGEQVGSFWLSSGTGVLNNVVVTKTGLQLMQSISLPMQWDNHLSVL